MAQQSLHPTAIDNLVQDTSSPAGNDTSSYRLTQLGALSVPTAGSTITADIPPERGGLEDSPLNVTFSPGTLHVNPSHATTAAPQPEYETLLPQEHIGDVHTGQQIIHLDGKTPAVTVYEQMDQNSGENSDEKRGKIGHHVVARLTTTTGKPGQTSSVAPAPNHELVPTINAQHNTAPWTGVALLATAAFVAVRKQLPSTGKAMVPGSLAPSPTTATS